MERILKMGIKTIGRFVLNSPTPTQVAANSNIVFTSNTISTDCIRYNSSTGEIQIRKPGVYMIYANFTAVGTVVGPVTVQMQQNGVSTPGASAAQNISTVGNYGSLSFNAVETVRTGADGNYATLSFKNIAASSYAVANVIIEKVA